MKEFDSQIVSVGHGAPSALKPLPFEGRMTETELEGAFCRNPGLFGEELLLLGRQLVDFAEDSRRLDVLAVDEDGEKVLVEFKVDPRFAFTELQALAYAGAYADVDNGFFPETLHRSATSKKEEGIPLAAGLVEDPSLEEATEVFLNFLDLDTLDDWSPSKQVRIKVIGPDFPARVLHNIKWLAEVYEMPIEAVQVELFEIEGTPHLRSDRIYPLPGADRFELSLREQEASKRRKNIRQNKDVLPLLVKAGILNQGDRIQIGIASLPKDVRSDIEAELDHADSRLSATVDEANPSKVLWRASENEEPELIPPARLPADLAEAVLGVDPNEVRRIPVGTSYIDEKTGKKLADIAREAGLWL